jgi:hypothetical protein
MTWQDVITLIKFLIAGLGGATGIWAIYMGWLKFKAKKKTTEGQLNIDTFNSILEESKELRVEFKKERDFLKEELRNEREVVKKMANTVIEITSANEKVLFQNKILQQHLKNLLGMRNIINIKNIKIAVLEDDKHDTELLLRLLNNNGIDNVNFYKDQESFLGNIDPDVRILIIDQNLSTGLTGMEIIKKLVESNEYRYFIMLSGMDDFNVIYNFQRLVVHGIYILKGRPESDDLIVKSIRNTVYYLNLLSETYNEINSQKT